MCHHEWEPTEGNNHTKYWFCFKCYKHKPRITFMYVHVSSSASEIMQEVHKKFTPDYQAFYAGIPDDGVNKRLIRWDSDWEVCE